ncbi:uncharacterized protein TNCT_328551 [Trichonephila clavata]|uniref:Uncharacterized protein n=1 Tax=Trichonephila clavata TaxID=2740835 RepID=A0A8X6KS25_TRICU|nr:uncharacterized protein TNCT_328551 [Trichonephila clavata]
MRLASSVSVVLLLRTLNCDAIVSNGLLNSKKFSADVEQSSSNSVSKSSELTSNDQAEKRAVSKQPESEMAPNFVSNEYNDFVSSDQGLSHKYDTSSNEPTHHELLKEPRSSDLPRRDFYNFFASRNFRLQPEDKLPLTVVNHISQKPLKAYYSTASQANPYPEPYDRLPPLQLLKFKNPRRKGRSNARNSNESAHRNDENSTRNQLDRSNIYGSGNIPLDEHPAQNNESKRFQSFLNVHQQDNNIQDSLEQEEIDVNRRISFDSNRTRNNESARSARLFNVRRNGERSIWNWMDQDDSYDDEITPLDMMSMMVDRIDLPSRDNEVMSLWKSHVPAMIAAGLIPLSMVLFAVLPIVIKSHHPTKVNKPQGTTTVTNSKTIGNSTEFLAPILDAMEIMTPRSGGSNCVLRKFCEIMKKDQNTWPLQETIKQMTSFINDSLNDTFGLKILINALKDGRCGEVACFETNAQPSKFFLHSKITERGE